MGMEWSPQGTGAPYAFRRAMIFIDGGYLRNEFKRQLRHENIDFAQLTKHILQSIELKLPRAILELIRVLYYDANVDASEVNKYAECDKYFQSIRNIDLFQVRLGRLIKSETPRLQGGASSVVSQ